MDKGEQNDSFRSIRNGPSSAWTRLGACTIGGHGGRSTMNAILGWSGRRDHGLAATLQVTSVKEHPMTSKDLLRLVLGLVFLSACAPGTEDESENGSSASTRDTRAALTRSSFAAQIQACEKIAMPTPTS